MAIVGSEEAVVVAKQVQRLDRTSVAVHVKKPENAGGAVV